MEKKFSTMRVFVENAVAEDSWELFSNIVFKRKRSTNNCMLQNGKKDFIIIKNKSM